MKLRNKKTGGIGNLVLNINPNRESYSVISRENGDTICGNLVLADYDTLAELNKEWEDAPEEPKEYWYIEPNGVIARIDEWGCFTDSDRKIMKQIGNYFETEEESEKAVRKLKAIKRLKDKGFSFVGWCDSVSDHNPDMVFFKLDEDAWETDTCEDLDLLFNTEVKND